MTERQQTIYLVAADDAPDLPVRFTGLDLSTYDSIEMHVQREDHTRFTRTVTPVGAADPEAGTVTWLAGDLVVGRHKAEFEFDSSGKKATLPRRFPLILQVRQDLA